MNVVFLAHWSAAFVEEQFYALYLAMSTQLADETSTCLSVTYFCEWHNQCAINHLIDCLFAPLDNNNTAARDTRHYPPTTSNDAHHQLAHCTADNTLFIVYFPPRHLAFFLASTGNRFARRYVWWQAEQASHPVWQRKNDIYCRVVRNALALLEFSRANILPQFGGLRLFVPFSRNADDLKYDAVATRLNAMRAANLCAHQRQRLIEDNPRFLAAQPPSSVSNSVSVMLLGACDNVPRRRAFKEQCAKSGIDVWHPLEHNYLFGVERQQFIATFVAACGNRQAVAVNVHQYELCALEQAKIYLLLANGCDVVVSERSRSSLDDALLETACHGRLLLVDSVNVAIRKIAEQCALPKRRLEALRNPPYYRHLVRNLIRQLCRIVNASIV